MNISVPDELRERMAAHDDEANWSAIAARAFTIHVAELDARKEKTNMESALERLRALRQEAEDADYNEGFRKGQDWALNHAGYLDLRAVAAADKLPEDDPDAQGGAYGWGAELVERVAPGLANNRGHIEQWSEQHIGEAYPRYEVVRGFVDGAIEVFDQV